jgi:abortive infection bacteriophage resistance protein
MKQHYTKGPLTYQQQAQRLIGRGLLADQQDIVEKLKAVSYYRLSGYWYPFRNTDNTFKNGTSLKKIWRIYTFDRQLRLIVMDAVERVEISARTQIVYRLSHKSGAFGYTSPANLPKLSSRDFKRLISEIERECKRSQEAFVKHYNAYYIEKQLPLWIAAEIMTFGMTLTMFRGLDQQLKQSIAKYYNVSDSVFESWLAALNGIRNICAHHGRLWNRELGYKPMIPRKNKHPQWHKPATVKENRIFAILTILRYMLKFIAPQSSWAGRLYNLLDEYKEIPIKPMGFPDNWKECPIWK